MPQDPADRNGPRRCPLGDDAWHKAFFEKNLSASVITTPEGRILACNDAYLALFGHRSLEEAQRVALASVYEAPGRRDELVARLRTEGQFLGEAIRFVRPDGRQVTAVENAIGVFDDHGQLAAIMATLSDVTELAAAQKALEQRMSAERSVGEISRRIATSPPGEIGDAMGEAVRRVGELAGADACYVVRLGSDGKSLEVAHGWLAPGVSFDVGLLGGVTANSLPGWLEHLARREPVSVSTAADLPPEGQIYRELVGALGLRSLLVVPLVYGGALLGGLGLATMREERRWQDEDVRLLELVGDVAAAALGRMEAEATLHRRLDELAALHAVSAACAGAEDEEALIERFTEIVGSALYPDDFGVDLVDETGCSLTPHPSYRLGPDSEIPPALSLGGSVAGSVLQDGRPRRIPDVSREPVYLRVDPRTRSELCVPIVVEGRILGIVNAESHRLDAFGEADERLLVTLAGHLATALARLRAAASERRRFREAVLLNRVIAAATSEVDFVAVLRTVCRELAGAFDVPRVRVSLWNPERTATTVVAEHTGEGLPSGVGDRIPILSDSQAMRDLDSGRALVITDTQVDPRAAPARQYYADTGAASLLVIPLTVGGRREGSIALVTSKRRQFSPEEIALAETVGASMSQALANARLYDETRRNADELAAVSRVSSALRAARTRSQMVEVILDQLLDLFGADGSALFVKDVPSGGVAVEMARGEWACRAGTVIPHGEGITAAILATGTPYLNNDVRSDPRLYEPSWVPGANSSAGVPIFSDGEAIGVLWTTGRRRLSEDDLRVLTSIADMASNALRRAGLHDQAERQIARLQALQAINQATSGSLDLRLTLGVISEHAMSTMQADAAAVLLYSRHLQQLRLGAGRGFRTAGIEQSRLRLGQGLAGRAALERKTVHLPDLASVGDAFVRKVLLAEEQFVSYTGVPLIAKGELRGVLEVYHRRRYDLDGETAAFIDALAWQTAVTIDSTEMFGGLQRLNLELGLAYDATLEGWVRALDQRDRETEGHTRRVTEMAVRLAQAVGIREDDLESLRRGALLHDIGKMAIPDGILLKPGALTEEEWEIVRRHPAFAYEVLLPVAHLRPALDIPYCHHERWDGSGYPRGLRGEEIPMAARVFAVVDVWDALSSNRPYRQAWPSERVQAYLLEHSGKMFDPRVVETFLRMLRAGDDA